MRPKLTDARGLELVDARMDIENATRFILPRLALIIRMQLEGCSYDEIGEELGVSTSRANQLAIQAAHSLRRMLLKLNGGKYV